MTDALVTGGTGFIGANVVRELVAAGATVRVLARPGGDRRALEGIRVELAEGDLLDAASVRRAVAGVQTVYHVAADYRLWTPDPAALYRANVEGTRVVLEAAGQAGAGRVVYTSSVGALGIPKDGTPGTEETPVTLADMVGDYKRSKFLAEQVALEFARRGLPVVVVNPSAPVGPWDVKPTPTGQMIVPAATCWPPSAASRASATSSATPRATSRSRTSSACWPRSPAAARRASACPTRWPGAAPPPARVSRG